MVRLPEWRRTEYGYYNFVGVYRLYLENDGTIWKLQIWEGERTLRKAKKLEDCHFISHDEKALKAIAFELLNEALQRLS